MRMWPQTRGDCWLTGLPGSPAFEPEYTVTQHSSKKNLKIRDQTLFRSWVLEHYSVRLLEDLNKAVRHEGSAVYGVGVGNLMRL
jgi:hypothetical protein